MQLASCSHLLARSSAPFPTPSSAPLQTVGTRKTSVVVGIYLIIIFNCSISTKHVTFFFNYYYFFLLWRKSKLPPFVVFQLIVFSKCIIRLIKHFLPSMKEMILWVMDVNKDVLELQLTVFIATLACSQPFLTIFLLFPFSLNYKPESEYLCFVSSNSVSHDHNYFLLPVIFQRNT